jgi:hypothetical protein
LSVVCYLVAEVDLGMRNTVITWRIFLVADINLIYKEYNTYSEIRYYEQ